MHKTDSILSVVSGIKLYLVCTLIKLNSKYFSKLSGKTKTDYGKNEIHYETPVYDKIDFVIFFQKIIAAR